MSHYETDLSVRKYPAISKAALEMSYCNGGVNRDRREADVLRSLDAWLSDGPDLALDLPAIDAWLATLDDEQLQTAVDGEESEAEQIVSAAPPGTSRLLTDIFDNVA
jgi:hypothetical protein